MSHRSDPLPEGSSPDNASRDGERQIAAARAELRRKLQAGEIDQTEFTVMMSVLG
jgi:hypothetical protein